MNTLRPTFELSGKRRIAALSCFAIFATGCSTMPGEQGNPRDEFAKVVADCSESADATAEKEYAPGDRPIAAFVLGVTEHTSAKVAHEVTVKILSETDDVFVGTEANEMTSVSPKQLQAKGYEKEFPGGGSIQVTLEDGEYHLQANCS